MNGLLGFQWWQAFRYELTDLNLSARLSWICGDKHELSGLKSLPSKGFRNLAREILYHLYTYPTLNPGEPPRSFTYLSCSSQSALASS